MKRVVYFMLGFACAVLMAVLVVSVPSMVAEENDPAPVVQGSSLLYGLVSYWRLDEPTGPRVDSRGVNELHDNGVFSGNGKLGSAAKFIDKSQYLYTDVSNDLDTGNLSSYSLAMWVYMPDLNNTEVLVYKGVPPGDGEYELLFNSFTQELYFFTDIALGDCGVSSRNVSVGWNYIVAIYDYDGFSYLCGLSINGENFIENTAAGGTRESFGALYVGSGGGFSFTGQIDSLGFWNRRLEQAEVAALYNGGAGSEYPFRSSCCGCMCVKPCGQ